MKALSVHAGPLARQRILEEGLHAEQFDVLVGASGGPKWFILFGLDKFLFGDFFHSRQRPLHTLGSSAGAWRLCCAATADPVAAISRLAKLYSAERYSEKPDEHEITSQARVMLQKVLGDCGADEIVSNETMITHVVADRCKGLGTSHRRWAQTLFLAAAASANAVSRSSLSRFFQRTLFCNRVELSAWRQLADIDTAMAPLSQENLVDVMIASGSIPFVLEGVRDIAGAHPGLYWDGGITDYHFDLPFCAPDRLVLYPHFLGAVTPGWFDKHLPWRKARREHFDNVVLLAPTPGFVATLPNGKLSDRNDFVNFSWQERQQIFGQVLEQSHRLADEFAELLETGLQDHAIRDIGNLA